MQDPRTRISAIPDAMPISRLLRLALGLGMSAMVVPPLLGASNAARLRVAVVFVTLVVIYAVVHAVVQRHLGWVNPYLGALIAVTPAAALFVFGDHFAAGAVLYVGVSLLVIAIAGQPGCEVLAIQAALSRQPTHLACLLFSPLDWIENKVTALVRRAG